MSNQIAINEKKYSWSDVNVTLLGRTVEGITAIEYGDKEDINPVKGRGKKPIGYTQGNYETEGVKLTLLVDEVRAIQSKLPKGQHLASIQPFPITVSYLDEAGGLVKETLRACKFMNNKRNASAGSTDALTVELDLFCLEIIW